MAASAASLNSNYPPTFTEELKPAVIDINVLVIGEGSNNTLTDSF